VEGPAEDVRLYTANIRSLAWQAMQVRGQEEERVALSSEGGLPPGTRRLPESFHELADGPGGMSALAAMCQAAGLEKLFLSALKL
jgi:hypothetical protein